MVACVRVGDRKILGHSYNVIRFLHRLWCHLLNYVLVVPFLNEFSNLKALFLRILNFSSLLYNLTGHFFLYVVSSFYRGRHKLIFRAHLDKGSFHHGVRSLKKYENLLDFDYFLCCL